MRKTEREYWDQGYERAGSIVPVPLKPAINWTDKLMYDLLSRFNLPGKQVLEVGGGGSAWLARLALEFPTAQFTALDYSPSGCDLVRRFAKERSLRNLAALEGDMFDPPPQGLLCDIAYSYGVVEHFEPLEDALAAIAAYVRPTGKMLTIIPNMAGLLGDLTRRYNKSVYDIHVPHDLRSFLDGHERAGLRVDCGGYLGSNNFGVIASCFASPSDRGYSTYLWLSRVSKILGTFEKCGVPLPASKAFSPYIFAIAAKD